MLQRHDGSSPTGAALISWSHTALYIGTPLPSGAFSDDAEVRAWVEILGGQRRIPSAWRQNFPKAAHCIAIAADGHAARAREVISEACRSIIGTLRQPIRWWPCGLNCRS